MSLVAARDQGLEDPSGIFLPSSKPVPLIPKTGWERLVRRALRFIYNRRRTSLALTAYGNSTLRNSEGSRPNKARRALRARATTPARLLLPVNMDPTQDELNQIQDALNWSGVQGGLATILVDIMGTLVRVREVP